MRPTQRSASDWFESRLQHIFHVVSIGSALLDLNET